MRKLSASALLLVLATLLVRCDTSPAPFHAKARLQAESDFERKEQRKQWSGVSLAAQTLVGQSRSQSRLAPGFATAVPSSR